MACRNLGFLTGGAGVFHFVRDKGRSDGLSRRGYNALRVNERVGQFDLVGYLGGDQPLTLTILALPVVLGPERKVLLAKVRAFVEELAVGWGKDAEEVVVPDDPAAWAEQPDGSGRYELAYRIA